MTPKDGARIRGLRPFAEWSPAYRRAWERGYRAGLTDPAGRNPYSSQTGNAARCHEIWERARVAGYEDQA